MNLIGIKSSLKPTLQAFAELTNNGLTGQITPLGPGGRAGCRYLTGGYDNLLAQIFAPQLSRTIRPGFRSTFRCATAPRSRTMPPAKSKSARTS